MPCPELGGHMQRRNFIALLGAAAAWPRATWAQGAQKMQRVSVLIGLAENDPFSKARLKAFRLGMRDLGWIEGRNVPIADIVHSIIRRPLSEP
jgi:putative tryptophan/tyrosine transport system substrate-binding protein